MWSKENYKMNRALRKLYDELNRERENELNKARLEAKEIVDMALAESEDILKISMLQLVLSPTRLSKPRQS